MSEAKALKKAQYESVETTIRKRRLLFARGVQRTHNKRLTRRVMFGMMAGWENPGPGRPEMNWAQRLVEPHGVSSHRGIRGKRPIGVRRRNGAMAHGGYKYDIRVPEV